jgi:hypothetical protein
MKKSSHRLVKSLGQRVAGCWVRLSIICTGAAALLWFLIRVIPKPSRASYPCQRAAFPVASGFVLWLCGVLAIKSGLNHLARGKVVAGCGVLAGLVVAAWTLVSVTGDVAAQNAGQLPTDWNFIHTTPNTPVGIARGINPGRVVWARDPLATKWAGHWRQNSDQWWLDENTDQSHVDALLAATLIKLTSATNGEHAWQKIFEYYNQHTRQMEHRGYRPGEVVAVKINLNNSSSDKMDNYIDASPQMVLAMVRQLVNQAHVRQADIFVYDARRMIPAYMLTKVWREFKDVRFLQWDAPDKNQLKLPVYGDYSRLETAQWVDGISYSHGQYKDAKLIPKQVFDATYLVNLALLKAHSYPYNTMEDGDSGQTAVTMTGKNHFGSIKGTPELHAAINTDQDGTPHAYSPTVDLAASPNLGAKTILYVLDGLYCGRKWRSYPMHFPNPPFGNRVEPYETPEWPASVLASMDGVALDSVGLDLLLAQTKNNNDKDGHPRILIRCNADDYLFEMAEADHPPSGTVYKQGGKMVSSLGVHERWDSDATKRYSRNLDPVNGKGIELIYIPIGGATNMPASTDAPLVAQASAPAVLPGKGLAQYDFFYAGEAQDERMFIVRDGRIVWDYTHPAQGEISDATLLPNGNVLFAHQHGVTEITANKKAVWNYEAPPNTEIHTAQPFSTNSVWFIQNGDPAKFIVINKATGRTENEFVLPTGNPKGTHGQFRHARLTDAGTLLVAHMDMGKVVEYDLTGNALWSLPVPGIWSATPLKNGNILVASNNKFVRELNRRGDIVWEWTPRDTPDYKLSNLQLASRLPNGNTLINDWFNQWSGKLDPATAGVQAIEVSPDKKVVWALRSWEDPAYLGPATTIQILPKL